MGYRPQLMVDIEGFEATFKFGAGLAAKELADFGSGFVTWAQEQAGKAPPDTAAAAEPGEPTPQDARQFLAMAPASVTGAASALFEAACCEWTGVDSENDKPMTCSLANRRLLPVMDKAALGFCYWSKLNRLGESVTTPAAPPTTSSPPESSTPTSEV